MKKFIILFLVLLSICSKTFAQNINDNKRATIYNALHLSDEQSKKREEILNKNSKIFEEKYQQLKKETCKLLALKKAHACISEISQQKNLVKNIEKDIARLHSKEDKEFKKCLTPEQKTKYKTIQKLQKYDLKKEISREKIYKNNPQMTEFARPQNTTCKNLKRPL